MALTVNLRHLDRDEPLELKGKLPAEELDLAPLDEMITKALPLTYDLQAEILQESVLAQGSLKIVFECDCVRCLKKFKYTVAIEHWACHLPLKGEDAVPVANDLVDLTPSIREDIFLALPQNPVCNPGCRGLSSEKSKRAGQPKRAATPTKGSSVWAALDKLKVD